MLVLLRARLRGSHDVRRSNYQLVLLRPSEDHAQMAQFCKQRAIHDAVPAPLGDMRATVGDGDRFRFHFTEAALERLPCMHHGHRDGPPDTILDKGAPEIFDLLARRPRQLCEDPRRNTVSLACVFGDKPEPTALSADVEDEDEPSVEFANAIAGHRSISSTASIGILISFPPSRKARSLPLATRFRTWRSEHCQRSARAAGV